MKKSYLLINGLLKKLMLLFALLTVSASAMADDIPVLTLDTEYTVAAFDSPTYQFTAPESGVVYMYCSSQDYPLLWKDSRCSDPVNLEINPYNNPRWSANVEAGVTYYVGYGFNFTMDVTTFHLTMRGPSGIEALRVDPDVNTLISVGYPIGITFNMPVEIENASLQGGTSEAMSLPANLNNANASFDVKDILYGWMLEGQLKENDDVTLTLSGVRAAANPDIKGGENGTMVFSWKSAPQPIALVKESVPAQISAKWPEGDPAGIATFEFSGNVADDAMASLTNGDLSKGGTYEQLPVSVNGNRVIVDLTGVIRSPATDDPYVLSLYNVKDLQGYPAYSPGLGTVGSYDYSIKFDNKPYFEPVTFSFTPAEGANIKDATEIYIRVDNVTSSFTYTSAVFFYTVGDSQKSVEIAKDAIEAENFGTYMNLFIDIPGAIARADAGSTVIFNLINDDTVIASAKYVYGESAEPDQFAIALVSPADGSTLEKIGADESIELNITGIPEKTDIEIEGAITDDATGENIKWCFFFPTDGDGYNYSSMMYDDVDMYKDHTYTLTITANAYPLDDEGFRGAPSVIGTASFKFYGAGQEFVYSSIELIGLDPDPATDEITSVDQNVVKVKFSGEVATFRVVEPMGMGMGTIDYEVAKVNADGSEWSFTIPASTIAAATGSIAMNMYAFDAEGHPLWKSALFDEFTFSGVPDAMKAKDETYYSLMYKCTVGSPDFIITPADGAQVESIDNFVVSYPSGINYSWMSWDDIVLYRVNGDDKEVVQSWSGMYFDPWENGDMCEYQGEEIVAWTLALDQTIKTPGVYTLEVPSCFFFLGNQFSQANSKAQSATVTVKDTQGIESIISDESASDVIYNISGQRVSSNYKGFVIKNGKKAFIK